MHSANTKPTTTKDNTTIIYLERKPQTLFLYCKNIFMVDNNLLNIYSYRNIDEIPLPEYSLNMSEIMKNRRLSIFLEICL